MIELMKELLEITDTSKDIVLNHYLNKAENAIKNHLNYSELNWATDMVKFQEQIASLAVFFYRNRKDEGILQQSQGSRSKTLKDGIPESIKATLPLPFIRVIG
ncbi:phage head-tail connector protein [Brassicibacter mesophilus]|uniref:phage head-tail connector protein n=1 Tax=Brassicibacter mesophilus TaxID=745119 RepID=UPI003D24B7D4